MRSDSYQRYKNSKNEGKTLRERVRILEEKVEDLEQELKNLKNKIILTQWQVATALIEGIVEFYPLFYYYTYYLTNIGLAQKIWYNLSEEDRALLEEKGIYDTVSFYFSTLYFLISPFIAHTIFSSRYTSPSISLRNHMANQFYNNKIPIKDRSALEELMKLKRYGSVERSIAHPDLTISDLHDFLSINPNFRTTLRVEELEKMEIWKNGQKERVWMVG